MTINPIVGIIEPVPPEIAHTIEAETGVPIIDLTDDLARFDYLYRTERFGQFQTASIARQITLLEFMTLERVHERWQVFALTNEQLRAELIGMVAFWIEVIGKRGLTHVYEEILSPHWAWSYSLYVATRICGIKYFTIYENLYLENSVLHEGLRDRPIRYGPPGLPQKLKEFLEENAGKTSHPAVAERYMKEGTRHWPIFRNTFSRIHRGFVVERKIGSFTRTDMRSRRLGRFSYSRGVAARVMKNHGQFKKLAREYKKRCSPPGLAPGEEGRSVVFYAHLQPEASTAPLAFFYHDARVVVRELIDMGYAVYFKEHPISFLPTIHHNIVLTPDYRSSEYYRDLAEMGCRFLDIDADNDQLLEMYDFAATCTGTVAMQAAAKGKWTIAFGATWFAGMPGIEDARDGLTATPAEMASRPAPTLPELFEYFSETHGHGLPTGKSDEDRYDFLKALAQLALSS